MSSRHNNTYLFLASWLGVAMIIAVCFVRMPKYLNERKRLSGMLAKLNDNITIEGQLTEFLDDIDRQTEAMETLMADYRQHIDSCDYERLNQSDITSFIDELPQLFANAAAEVVNLGYQPREQLAGFEDLVFEVQLRCKYQGMRRVLYALETNPAGIIIDRFEFLNFDDENRLTRLQLVCRVRFNMNES